MSAFLCSDEHLSVLVHAAANASHGGLYWFHKGQAHRITDPDGEQRAMAMLFHENARSLRARYQDAGEMFGLDARTRPPRYDLALAFQRDPSPVEVLKAVGCYEYQACEHEAWPDSEAAAFCQALRLAVISDLEGYEAAPWEWTPETFKARRGNVISLSGLIRRRRA